MGGEIDITKLSSGAKALLEVLSLFQDPISCHLLQPETSILFEDDKIIYAADGFPLTIAAFKVAQEELRGASLLKYNKRRKEFDPIPHVHEVVREQMSDEQITRRVGNCVSCLCRAWPNRIRYGTLNLKQHFLEAQLVNHTRSALLENLERLQDGHLEIMPEDVMAVLCLSAQ